MFIKIRDISVDGTSVDWQHLPKDLGIDDDFIEPETKIILQGSLSRVDGFVLAKLEISYTMDTNCARCLEPIMIPVKKPWEIEIEYQSLEERIDFLPLIREEVMMGYQMRVLCQENCLGICGGCGAYLNEESCECSKENKK